MSDQHIHIYLGGNDLDMRKQVSRFFGMFSDPTSASMNISRLDALLVSDKELANITGAMPFLASQRLVILENVGKRYRLRDKDKEKDKNKAKPVDDRKKFLSFLETLPDFTCFVIVEVEEIKDSEVARHWLVKWAREHSEKVECKIFALPTKGEMSRWIVKEAKEQGGSIDFPAAGRLAEMTGEDTRQAAMEITKLLTYVNYAHSIGIEDVEAVSIVTASVSIFDMVEAMGKQDGRTAQKLFHRMLDEKDAHEIFGMVIRQIRLLTMARDLMDDGVNSEAGAGFLGVPPFVVGKFYEQARAFSLDTLKAIYHRLLAMDEASKTGGMPLDASLDILIVELSGKR